MPDAEILTFPPRKRENNPYPVSCIICQGQIEGDDGFHLIIGESPDDINYRGQSFCGLEHLAEWVGTKVMEA